MLSWFLPWLPSFLWISLSSDHPKESEGVSHWTGLNWDLSVEEEEARSVGGGHVLAHVTDFEIVDEASEEQQQTKQQEYPPQPVLPIEVAIEVVWESDNKNPLDQGESKSTDGSVAPRDGVSQAEREAEADPVEQKGHEKGQHEDPIIPNS